MALVDIVPNSQFWSDVIEAYGQVAANHGLMAEVARDGKLAKVFYDEAQDAILIIIVNANTETVEPLIEP